MRKIVLTVIAFAASIPPVAAQDASRYALERTDTGYVRLDRETGQMSLCVERDGQLVCRLAADERDAMLDEVTRLTERLDALEARLSAVEGAPPERTMPSETEMENALTFMERFFRRFIGIIREFESTEPPTAPPEGRT